MATSINASFERSADKTSITVTDLTGVYNASTNPGGYGSPNPAVGDYTDFVITVTPADPYTYAPTGTPVDINAYATLPSNANGTFAITSLALLGSADTVIPDGVYRFDISADYSGGAGEGTSTFTGYAIFYETTECCINALIATQADCNCEEDMIQELNKAKVWLSVFQPVVFNGTVQDSQLVACAQWDKAAELLVSLNEICSNSGCQGC